MEIVYNIYGCAHREEVEHIFSINATDNVDGEYKTFPAFAVVNKSGLVMIFYNDSFETIEEVNDHIINLGCGELIDFMEGKMISCITLDQFAAMRKEQETNMDGEIPPEVFAQMQADGQLPMGMAPIQENDNTGDNDSEETE